MRSAVVSSLRCPITVNICTFVLLTAALPALAQSTEPKGGAQRSTWLMYFGDHPVSQNWEVHLEGQYRREGVGQRWEQLLLRPGVQRSLPHGFSTLVAYTYVRGYPFEGGRLGAASPTGPQPEHRVLEELQLKHRLLGEGKNTVKLSHRLRLEQRWLGTSTLGLGVTDWGFAERARYRLTATVPFRWNNRGPRPDYASAYNEFFLNFGPHGGAQAFDQNRTYGALGWNVGPVWQLEAGYMHQYQPRPNGIIGVSNDTLQFTVNAIAPFRRGLLRK